MKVNIIVDFDPVKGKFDVGFKIKNGQISDEFMPNKNPSVKLCV